MKFTRVTEHTGGVPIFSWIDENEYWGSDSVVQQSIAIASLPMAYHHVALMPDAHGGYGMPIGGVLALEGAICPAAVGYDIGCGMLAFQTDIPFESLMDHRSQINDHIRRAIPMGPGGQRKELSKHHMVPDMSSCTSAIAVGDKITHKIDGQMGTLGGGNHFIEIDRDDDGLVWVVIHSGSRGVGHALAGHYMKLAEENNGKWFDPTPKDLAVLSTQSPFGESYMQALDWSLRWALYNREVMAGEILDILECYSPGFKKIDSINVHHNDATFATHFDKGVWVHRKGATAARSGEKLVIPGNMGQGTAICTGLGNEESFFSCSHGAGRRMGRNEAKRTLNLDECKARLAELDVVLSCGDDGALDEMPEAYKDFFEVMEAQKDLVTVDKWLHPISVIKG